MNVQAKVTIEAEVDPVPRRVLDLRDSPWVDGPGRTILDTASTIDPRRYRITIGAFSGAKHGDHAYLSEAVRRRLDTYPIAEKRALDPEVLRRIMDWCRYNAVDIIHTHDFRSDLYGLMAARRLNIPAVSTCHGWIANNLKGRLYTRVDKFLLRFFDRVIAVSGRMRDQLVACGVAAERIDIVRNALVVDDYRPERRNSTINAEFGVPPGYKVVASIGRLSPEKCQDLYLQAASRLLRDFPETVFLLIGIGPEESRLRALAGQLNIADKVIFAGYRSDMQRIYNGLDLVVQSSNTEGMPNVVLEALLMRVPVVATDVGGTSEIMEHEVSGLLVPPNDLDALVEAVGRVLSAPDALDQWTDAGERHVRTHFSHAARVMKIMEAYDSVLDRRSE